MRYMHSAMHITEVAAGFIDAPMWWKKQWTCRSLQQKLDHDIYLVKDRQGQCQGSTSIGHVYNPRYPPLDGGTGQEQVYLHSKISLRQHLACLVGSKWYTASQQVKLALNLPNGTFLRLQSQCTDKSWGKWLLPIFRGMYSHDKGSMRVPQSREKGRQGRQQEGHWPAALYSQICGGSQCNSGQRAYKQWMSPADRKHQACGRWAAVSMYVYSIS